MMHVRSALLGAAIAGVAVAAFVGLIVRFGLAPMTADAPPPAFEATLAMTAVHAAAERAMGAVVNPLPFDAANLRGGLAIYKERCLLCHGAADGKPSAIAAAFYVPAPQFASDGAEDDPEGATFWKIRHGIRFSAMPAFGQTLSGTQVWQVSMLLRHMDALPEPVRAQWKALPSAGEPGAAMSEGSMRR